MAAEDSAPTELMTCSVAPVPPRTGAQVSSPTCDDSDMGAGWRPDRSTPLAPAFCIPTAPQPASLATNNKTFESGVAQRDRELTPGASCEQAPWVWRTSGGPRAYAKSGGADGSTGSAHSPASRSVRPRVRTHALLNGGCLEGDVWFCTYATLRPTREQVTRTS